MLRRVYHIVFFLFVGGAVTAQRAERLSCEQRFYPEGIDVQHPRLSWRIVGGWKDLRQTAYQLLVASSEEKLAADKGDLWNSGKVQSDQSWLVPYAGVRLKSRMVCFWKVKVWTTAGEGGWSASSWWTMGLLEPGDWKARWIGYDQPFPWDSVSKFSRLSARYFRKKFRMNGDVRSAVLYIAGLGHYQLLVNGVDVGKQVLGQAPTDYTKSVLYKTFNVAEACHTGENVLDVVLGNGRYFTMRPKYKPKKIKEFGFPKLLLQLEVEDEKGRRMIVSDTSWRFTADGPIRTNNEYDGEECDATKELKDWMKPQVVAAPGGRLMAQMNTTINVKAMIRPVALHERPGGVWILDMGQNMAGWLQMRVKGTRGDKVTLRYAESLQPNGELYTANLRDAKATDIYTEKGGEMETWHPLFVFHGFRYVEIHGYPGKPTLNDFDGLVVYDNLFNAGTFQTSDTLLNKLLVNAWWGINANYKGMPIDCPQRNERMPWLGDRGTSSLGESYLFDNGLLYAKWLDDIEESQRPDGQLPDVAPAYWNYYSDNMTWPGVYILVADMLYNQYADLGPIEKHYASMKKWLHYMSSKYEKDGIMTKDKYGDWCVPPESPELIHSRDSLRNTDGQLIATAYYYYFLGLMRHFSELLHKPDDMKVFEGKGEKVKDAFNRKFFEKDHYSNNTVTANLLPLYFGMAPAADRQRVFASIVRKIEEDNKGHISTGVIGTQWLMRGLSLYGRADLAYRIASNTDYPSWGYMVEHGATTIWELWNGDTANPEMNSQNHVMLLGDLIAWFFEDVAGIAPGAPGFKRIKMAPVFPAGLDSVHATYQTPYGEVSSQWVKKGGGVIWDIAVPPNAEAEVHLPDGEVKMVGAGNYRFETQTQFIYEQAPFPECHASTIAETPKGLVAAWFGGTKERNPDVCIYVSRKDKGQRVWTTPVNVANGIVNDTLRYACWNPVLYQVPGGELLLFYKIGPSPALWKGWLIRSSDGGVTWSAPKALPEGFLGPIKNKPVLLDNGMLICPTSTEGHGWKVHFEMTEDWGKRWTKSEVPGGAGLEAIQPSILFHKDGSLQALCRSQNRAILETWSKDKGKTWSPLEPTSLPNNNSGTDAVTLKDGRQLLVYNHVLPPPGKSKGERSPLNVAVSPDGKTWYAALVLENDTLGQYSYPSVIQSSDGMVHIVYTWRRKKIKYIELDPSKLKLEKIVDGVWPETVKK